MSISLPRLVFRSHASFVQNPSKFSYVDQVDEDHRLLQKMVVQLAGKYGVKCLSAQVFAPANLQ